MEKGTIAQFIHNVLTEKVHKWKIDGRLTEPTFDDVERLVKHMFEDMLYTDYDCIESGGILLKRDGDKIDVYVHLGELDEDTSP